MPQVLKAFLFILATFGLTMVVAMLVAVLIKIISTVVQRKPSGESDSSK